MNESDREKLSAIREGIMRGLLDRDWALVARGLDNLKFLLLEEDK